MCHSKGMWERQFVLLAITIPNTYECGTHLKWLAWFHWYRLQISTFHLSHLHFFCAICTVEMGFQQLWPDTYFHANTYHYTHIVIVSCNFHTPIHCHIEQWTSRMVLLSVNCHFSALTLCCRRKINWQRMVFFFSFLRAFVTILFLVTNVWFWPKIVIQSF